MMTTTSRLVLAAATAGFVLAASPAFAWVCTAKNARGALYSASGIVRVNVVARALAKCRANSVLPGSCYIVRCGV